MCALADDLFEKYRVEAVMTNKEIVLNFIDQVFNAWNLEPVEQYVREDYRQHSPEVKDGRAGFVEFLKEFFKEKPHMHVVKIAEDGDMVFVFFKCTFGDDKNHVAKVCDIYRLKDGMLAEHWDVLQQIDPNDLGVSGNGQF